MSAHGFRSSASTILNEYGFNPDVIEAALGIRIRTRSGALTTARSIGRSALR